jgi:DsbC/DsbD-like thiol-disulfide interchange protein
MRRSLILLPLLLATAKLAAQPVSAPHVTVDLVPEMAAAAPGKPFRVGLRMELEKEWHTYWRNPGDVGFATTLELTLPPGFTAGEIQWPYPRLEGDPPEVSYVYDSVLVLPVTITPPATMAEGESVTIGAKASWLVCNLQCIPGKAELSLTVPVGEVASAIPTAYHEEFAATDARLPRTARKITMNALRVGDHYELVLTNADGRAVPLPTDVTFLASEEGVIDHSGKQRVEPSDRGIVIHVPVSPTEEAPPTKLRGVLLSETGWNGGGLKAITVDTPIAVEQPAPSSESSADGGAVRAR